MQEHRVVRIRGVLGDLQPVRRIRDRIRHQLVVGQVEGVVDRELRHPILRPHVHEQQAFELDHGIGAVEHPFLDPAIGGLARRVEDGSVDGVLPAVVAAPDTAFRHVPELEGRVAMAAVQMKAAVLAPAGLEHHQILAEESGPEGEIARNLLRHPDRPPESPQILPARRARARLGQQRIGRRTGGLLRATEVTLRQIRPDEFCNAHRSSPVPSLPRCADGRAGAHAGISRRQLCPRRTRPFNRRTPATPIPAGTSCRLVPLPGDGETRI